MSTSDLGPPAGWGMVHGLQERALVRDRRCRPLQEPDLKGWVELQGLTTLPPVRLKGYHPPPIH